MDVSLELASDEAEELDRWSHLAILMSICRMCSDVPRRVNAGCRQTSGATTSQKRSCRGKDGKTGGQAAAAATVMVELILVRLPPGDEAGVYLRYLDIAEEAFRLRIIRFAGSELFFSAEGSWSQE